MTAGEWVATVISAASFGVALWSVRYSRRSAAAAVEANVHAKRAADAAERSAAADEAMAPSPPQPVVWKLTWSSGHLYVLRNRGTADATGVTLTTLPSTGLMRGDEVETVPTGEAMELLLLETDQTSCTSLRVTCDQLPDPVILPVP